MKTLCGMEFADSIGVLYALKEAHGHKTIQETYALLESDASMDVVMEILHIAYNKAHNDKPLTFDQFIDLLETQHVGIIKLTEIFQAVTEALMFSGMTDEEIAERKNFLMNLQK